VPARAALTNVPSGDPAGGTVPMWRVGLVARNGLPRYMPTMKCA